MDGPRYIAFFVMVMPVTHFLTHVEHEYEVSNAINEALTDDFYEGIETFGTVANYANFWSWAKQGLLPAVFTDTHLIGGSNLVFGAIRFRQIRVKPDSCSVSAADSYGISGAISPCYAANVDGDTQQTTPFGPNGRYTYTGSGLSSIKSRFNQFSDDGYYTDIPITSTLAEATAAVQQLIDDNWLSSPTRVAAERTSQAAREV